MPYFLHFSPMYPLSGQATVASSTVGGYREAAQPVPKDQEPAQGKWEAKFGEQASPAPSGRHKAREEFWSSAPQIVEGCRRGDSARRQYTNAYEECNFPSYPIVVPEHGDFSLPMGIVDNQAPLSARKWELALSLASFAKRLAEQRQEMHGRLFSGQTDQVEEYDHKRVRRPTAIMRQNVEVARMMGVPGTRQKYISHDAMGEDTPAPQHLSRLKERAAPERSRVVAPARTHASKETIKEASKEAGGGGGGGGGGSGSAGVGGGGGGGHREKRSKEMSPVVASSGGGQKQARSLPVLSQLPPTCIDEGTPITLATVQAVLDADTPIPVLPVPSLPLRRVQGIVLAAEPSDGKRKRRPPGWLDGHTQEGDNGNSDEEGEQGGAAAAAAAATTTVLLTPRPAQLIADSKRSKLPPAVNVVHATMMDSRHASAAADGGGGGSGGAQYTVTILGIASQSVNEARYKAEPTTPNPSSTERSPRMRASEPSAWRKERDRQEDDTFQVYFGDLPSPRVIEVVKPKEVQLPSWRVIATAETRRAAAGDSGSSDEDTNDAVFQCRHNRALERAVAAARVWASEMVRKERSSHGHHGSCKPDGEGGAGEEWRHRPSELAALCYAATRQFSAVTGASPRCALAKLLKRRVGKHAGDDGARVGARWWGWGREGEASRGRRPGLVALTCVRSAAMSQGERLELCGFFWLWRGQPWCRARCGEQHGETEREDQLRGWRSHLRRWR